MKYIIAILFIIFSCKTELDNNLKNSILKILAENQKVHELLISQTESLPEVNLLLASIKEAKSLAEKNERIKKDLEKMELLISNINLKDQEAFFESLSSFSETLTDILKVNNIQTEYNKFYCPMVSKYWVAKGDVIQNPYASDMRECGELVK